MRMTMSRNKRRTSPCVCGSPARFWGSGINQNERRPWCKQRNSNDVPTLIPRMMFDGRDLRRCDQTLNSIDWT
jgi:hypothetical protein